MYYLKYNGIDLTQLVKVRDVSLPSLPTIEHNEIEMWDMDGNIFSSLSYGNKEIEITAIIQPLDPNDLELYVNDVKRAFYVREPQPLFLGDETRYILATTEGEVSIVELGKGTCELTVNLIAYYPYWIAKEVQLQELTSTGGTVQNNGDVPTTPVITIGVGGDTTFYQLENDKKERILIGEMPRVQKTTIKAFDTILADDCKTTSGWVQSSAGIDAGCGTGGTLAVTDDGGGLCIGSFGSGSSTWKGACYRKNLSTPLTNFRVKARLNFNSTGNNGDPTRIEYKDYGGDNLQNVTSGSITYTYKVKVNTSLNVRSGPGTNYSRIGSYKNGQTLSGTPTGGWLKHTYNGRTAYCSMQYLETIANDNRTSNTICNFVTNKATALRVNADEWSTARCTVPAGTVVRCWVNELGESTKFRQLKTAYKGMYGHIKSSDLTRASEMSTKIEYTVEGETADDKQGRLQVYGFSSNGVQLFSLSVIDDSEWYEATYPLVKVNGKDFLYEEKYIEPKAKTKQVESNDTIKYENVLSGRLGNWNEFYGDIQIERKDNVWYAYVSNNGRLIQSSKVVDSTNGSEKLTNLVIYIGTSNVEKASGMAVQYLQVQSLSDIVPAEHNVQQFVMGDVIEIDCGVPSVKLNDVERNDLVDIGSQFFDLQVGDNSIKMASDDKNATLGIIFNEKYL